MGEDFYADLKKSSYVVDRGASNITLSLHLDS